MNVYLIEDDGGVTVFDCGVSDMTAPLAAAGARLGGIKRIVLGHADADHRGAAPGLERARLLPPGRPRGRRVADPPTGTTGTAPSSIRAVGRCSGA